MAAMAKSSGEVLRLEFNRRLTVQFAAVYRELDDAFGPKKACAPSPITLVVLITIASPTWLMRSKRYCLQTEVGIERESFQPVG
jgi:hypothetical protein